MSFFDVLEGCIADVHNLSSGNVSCLRSYLRSELVNDSSISKGSSSHDFIITSSCSISVKICRLNISLAKETGSRGILSDVARRRYMVSGNRIAEPCESISIGNTTDFRQLFVGMLEEGWVVDIG